MTFKQDNTVVALPAQEQEVSTLRSRKSYLDDESIFDLYSMLRYRRPAGGVTEEAFIKKFLDPLATPDMPIHQDGQRNLYFQIGENPQILWSSHTDSVHRMEGEQSVVIDGDWFRLPAKSKSNCLGADDAAGMWLMREMIKSQVPGLYVFHYGEEKGCIGSSYIAKQHPEYLGGIKMAVAFDRRDYTDVITFQMSTRCASDEFAQSLADQLGRGFRPDPTGVYTDTASYTQIVPECTNVSVGYFNEHSASERLNIPHIVALRDSLIKIDGSKLIVKRDPSVIEEEDYWGYGPAYGYSSRSGSTFSDGGTYKSKYGNTYKGTEEEPVVTKRHHGTKPMPETMEELLYWYSDEVAEILENYGVTVESLWDDIQMNQSYGHSR